MELNGFVMVEEFSKIGYGVTDDFVLINALDGWSNLGKVTTKKRASKLIL